MYAILKAFTNAVDMTLTKKVLNKVSISNYLKNKFFLGLFIYLIYAFHQSFHLSTEGILFLGIILALIVTTQFLSFYGLRFIDASTFGVMHQSKVVVVLLIGTLFGNVITPLKTLGVLLCVLGVLFMVKSEKKKQTKNTVLGIIIVAVSVTLVAINVNLIEYAFSKNFFSQTTYVTGFLISVLMFFNVKSLFENKNKEQPVKKLDKNEFMLIQVIGLLSVLTIAFQSLAIEHLGAYFTAITASITPVLVLTFSVLLKTEKLNFQKIIGVIIAISGVITAALSL